MIFCFFPKIKEFYFNLSISFKGHLSLEISKKRRNVCKVKTVGDDSGKLFVIRYKKTFRYPNWHHWCKRKESKTCASMVSKGLSRPPENAKSPYIRFSPLSKNFEYIPADRVLFRLAVFSKLIW